jgi:apolipoprotein N-acyltransferase
MRVAWHTRALLALASGATLALSFPNYNLPLLAWTSVGLLVLASLGARPSAGLLLGFLHGVVFYPLCVPWIDTVMHQYGSVDSWTSAGILGLLTIAFSIFPGIFSWVIALASAKGEARACLIAPFIWVALELARTKLILGGFPWNLTGYAAAGNLPLLQLTSLTGIYGLSFVIASYGSLVTYAIVKGRQRVWKAVLITTGMLFLVALGGGHFVPVAVPHRVAHLVQTNFPQSETYPGNWLEIHAGELDELDKISADAAKQARGLVVWPEVPAPFSFQEQPFAQRAVKIARDSGDDFLVGVVDWKLDGAGKWLASNSAVLLNPGGQRIFAYDKIHLVPFGEYVPMRRWLRFAGRLTADISDFTPGKTAAVGPLPGGTFGVFICYEAIFPADVRQFMLHGAQLLVNISNDGWFGRSSAPAQHLMMARVRAAENRRWLLRDTNNGFTADIDPYGRIVAQLPTDIRGELDAPYDFRADLTPYTRLGDWFAWLCVITSVVLLALALRRRSASGTSGRQGQI